DFALASAWERVVEEMEQRRSLVSATVAVPARLVPVMRIQFGRHCEVVGDTGGGRTWVRVAAHMARGRRAARRVRRDDRGRGAPDGPRRARQDRRRAGRALLPWRGRRHIGASRSVTVVTDGRPTWTTATGWPRGSRRTPTTCA